MRHDPPLPAASDEAADLRSLKVLAVILPVTAVVVGELVRAHLIDPSFPTEAEHLVAGGLAILAVLAFTGLMLTGIERAQRSLVRQNRDLRLATAISGAPETDDSVDQVVRRTLATVLGSTGAHEASVEILDNPELRAAARTIRVTAGERPLTPSGLPVDLPLWSDRELIGRLRIEPGRDPMDRPDPGVLELIGHELACAIQIRQLVDDLRRRRHEATALYDVALQVTNRLPLVEILRSVRTHAERLLDVDEAALCLSEPASAALRAARLVDTAADAGDGVICFCPTLDGRVENLHAENPVCPVRDQRAWATVEEAPLRSSDANLGELWVGRRHDRAFTDADRDLLAGLADLAAIAIVSANLRQREEMAAIVAERERIAREMHDSLAQVLATTHLRLRALEARPEVRERHHVAAEVAALGDLTHEAFVDVREAILGLRESSHHDRVVLASLRVYLEKFSHQTGLVGRLETDLPDDLGLPPAAEIQIIRVIQEALTNVRKHAGASQAVVRVEADADGVDFVVEDDGRGFDSGEVARRDDGFGLHSMRERMSLVGGTLSIHSAPGQGTRVTARLAHPAGLPTPVPRSVHEQPIESYAHLAG